MYSNTKREKRWERIYRYSFPSEVIKISLHHLWFPSTSLFLAWGNFRKAVISLENKQPHRYALEPAGTFFSDAGHCFQMVSNDYFLYFLWFFCHSRYADTQIRRYAGTQIRRYADRCSPVMSSNQLPEVVVVGFAGSPPSSEDIKAIPEILAW
jgi:hypothetical protein